jgi:putative hydrolase of the HAD superfamily
MPLGHNAGMPIRAAIFDIGGVLTTSPVQSIRAFEKQEGLEDGALRPLFISHDGVWSRFERSELTPADFMPAFEEEARTQLGLEVSGAGFLASFFGGQTRRENYIAAVQRLRGHVKVGAITNNVTREEQEGESMLPVDELFDVLIESSKVGLRKPDPRIYLMACEQLEVAPAEAVFLDDFGVNLKAARELGMTTIKVDETDAALHELERVVGLTLS